MSRVRFAPCRPVLHILLATCLGMIFTSAIGQENQGVGYGSAARGGADGPLVIVRDEAALREATSREGPLRIRVEGDIRFGSLAVKSSKTLEGAPGARLTGALHLPPGSNDIILRNLTLTNPTKRKNSEGFDGMTIRGGKDIWVDSCTFVDCGDGAVDVTMGSDRVTISNCKFHYTDTEIGHRFPILALGLPDKKSKGRLHLTLYGNWFSSNCTARMPAARKARIHQFNNFFDCPGNEYCSNSREEAEILSENNVFRRVRNPLISEKGGKVRSRGDVFEKTSGRRDEGNDDVFKPSYKYKLLKTSEVAASVKSRAGAR